MKKVLCLILAVIMVFPLMVSANSQGNAETLKKLDLFKGTDKGFELEREASRVEAVVTKEASTYKDKMWFATMDEVVKYIYEKQNASLSVEGDEKLVKVKLTDTLDNKKFDMPLTVKVSAPSDATSASVTVNGKKQTVEIKEGYVIFNLIPDKEIAEIEF